MCSSTAARARRGLRIRERLTAREDVELIELAEEERKDVSKRKWALNACDAAILCLPDAAAREAVSMVENERTVVLDASTAHRTAPAGPMACRNWAGRRWTPSSPPAAWPCPAVTPAALSLWSRR